MECRWNKRFCLNQLASLYDIKIEGGEIITEEIAMFMARLVMI